VSRKATESETANRPCRGDVRSVFIPLDYHSAMAEGTGGTTAIRNVATGPKNTEANHHSRPLRPFA
jgi:hypothetical protein